MVELIANRITFDAIGGFVDVGSRRFTSIEGVIVQELSEAGVWHSFTKGWVSYRSTVSAGVAIGEVARDTLVVTSLTVPVRKMAYARD